MLFNKTLSFIVALLCLSSTSVVGQSNKQLLQFETVQALRTFLKYSPTWTPLISAHRGGPRVGFPENAIETFANTITFHAAIIETDISLTKDSIGDDARQHP